MTAPCANELQAYINCHDNAALTAHPIKTLLVDLLRRVLHLRAMGMSTQPQCRQRRHKSRGEGCKTELELARRSKTET